MNGQVPADCWPRWSVELGYEHGGHANEHHDLTAPDRAYAVRSVRELLAGTGLVPRGNVWPACLPPQHPRFVATEAKRLHLAATGGYTGFHREEDALRAINQQTSLKQFQDIMAYGIGKPEMHEMVRKCVETRVRRCLERDTLTDTVESLGPVLEALAATAHLACVDQGEMRAWLLGKALELAGVAAPERAA